MQQIYITVTIKDGDRTATYPLTDLVWDDFIEFDEQMFDMTIKEIVSSTARDLQHNLIHYFKAKFGAEKANATDNG